MDIVYVEVKNGAAHYFIGRAPNRHKTYHAAILNAETRIFAPSQENYKTASLASDMTVAYARIAVETAEVVRESTQATEKLAEKTVIEVIEEMLESKDAD